MYGPGRQPVGQVESYPWQSSRCSESSAFQPSSVTPSKVSKLAKKRTPIDLSRGKLLPKCRFNFATRQLRVLAQQLTNLFGHVEFTGCLHRHLLLPASRLQSQSEQHAALGAADCWNKEIELGSEKSHSPTRSEDVRRYPAESMRTQKRQAVHFTPQD